MRIQSARLIGLVALVALLTSSLAGVSDRLGSPVLGGGAAAAPAKPNIILIMTDDLDARSVELMPNVASLLAAQGTTFSNFFITTPMCCPSRASILRGQYAHNHGVLRNNGDDGGFETFNGLGREESTVATWLQSAGYRTGLFGKYLNGYATADIGSEYVPPGWDEWNVGTNHKAYSNYDYQLNENGNLVEYGRRPQDFLTDVLTAKATNFIASSGSDPFFMYITPYSPHSPSTAAPRHEGAFTNVTAPRPPSFNEDNVRDKPPWLRDAAPLSPEDVQKLDERYRQRLRSLMAVDDMVAGIVEALRRKGALESTYVVFTSDNGYHLGEHRVRHGKGSPYDEATHVPFVVRGPGVPAGQVVSELALNIDLAPTFAEIAGTDAAGFVDGRSLMPLLNGGRAIDGWRQALLIESFGKDENKEEDEPESKAEKSFPPFRGVRTTGLLYVEYDGGERELYDVRKDPYQLENLADRADRKMLASLSARIDKLSRCSGAGCRSVENAPLGDLGPLASRSSERPAVSATTGDEVFKPDADARVHKDKPDQSYGNANALAVDGGGNPIESYLRFDIRGVDGPVRRATLRLHVPKGDATGTRDGPAVYRAEDRWTERGITWNDRPKRSGSRLDNAERLAPGTWAVYDVTAAVKGTGDYTFVLVADSDDGVVFASRESREAPQLVIETDGSGRSTGSNGREGGGDRDRDERGGRDPVGAERGRDQDQERREDESDRDPGDGRHGSREDQGHNNEGKDKQQSRASDEDDASRGEDRGDESDRKNGEARRAGWTRWFHQALTPSD